MNDLVSLLSLPAMWAGGDPALVVKTMLGALVSMLRLDFVYVRLGRVSETPIETIQLGGSTSTADAAPDIGRVLRESLGLTTETWPPGAQIVVGDASIAVVVMRLGLQADLGIMVAGSHRADFPGETEKLVLSVAANEMATGLREAQLLSEQRRLADELEKRVERRTRELADTNEALRREIVERRRAEEALSARELRLRSIIDGVPGLVGILTPDGSVEAVNRRIVEYCGRTLEELRDWGTNGAIHADDVPHVAEVFARSIALGVPYEIQQRMRRFDGEYRWFNNRGVPERDESGRIVCWYVLLTDIDERKRFEGELRRSETLLAEAQRLSGTGSFLWQPESDSLTWSAELYRMFELDEGGITFDKVGSRIHADDRAIFNELLNEGRRAGGDLDAEMRLVMPDGRVKFVHTIARSYEKPGGQREYVGAVQDVTERHRSDEALSELRSDLAHATRAMSLGVLTASIAHEVSQPLAGIIANSGTGLRMLGSDPPNVEGAREAAKRTLRDANRASDVVVRLRSLFGRKETSSDAVDLNEAAREVLALLSGDLQRNSIVLRTELAEALPSVRGDRVELQQVVLNLVSNASEAMRQVADRPRRLLVATTLNSDGCAQLTVKDSGVGLNPMTVARLFEAFYTTKTGGMGIGLFVSRSIIESHEGRLWAAPNDDGAGASFSFSVPCFVAAEIENALRADGQGGRAEMPEQARQ